MLGWLSKMRATRSVWRDESTGSVHVFGYQDLLHVLSNHTIFGSDFGDLTPSPPPDVPNFMEGVLTMTDPPRHGKLRKLVSQAFTPRSVAQLEPRIRQLTKELFDNVADQSEFDLVTAVTYPLPVIVIAEMLGIPSSDHALFRDWGEALLSNNYELPAGTVPDAPAITDSTAEKLRQMHAYLMEHIRDRRLRHREDLIGRLVAAEVDGDRLTDTEVVSFLNFLLLAGHLTTTLLMGNTLLCFEEAPEAMAEVRADRTLVEGTIEEVLRYRPPVVFGYRLTKSATSLGGVDIPPKTPVVMWLLSGNHDERQFDHADRFDIHRSPNPHLTFGHGIHFCLGAPLARLESRIVLNELLDRYAEVACGEPVFYEHSPEIYGAKSLPLTVRRA
ncbi:cytochrome P450 [Actinomadura rubrobrunea]|uniref:Cytochrome P450 n=1 Tax=Actinomadura rubrobrunea TaxID=115335 RepID=A0A9W6PWE1_9ACTN|nr:cytochrome P450 [Actinomadura rubrobrunea]